VHGWNGVGVEGRDIRRPPGECRSVVKSVGFRGTLGFSFGGFSGRGDHGRFDDRGFRGRRRDFRDFAWDSFALASSGRASSRFPISSSAFLLLSTRLRILRKKAINRVPE
jgi:hypothetical protein